MTKTTEPDLPPKMKKVLRELSGPEAEALFACLRDTSETAKSGQQLSEILTRHGHSISATTCKLARKALVNA